MNKEKNARTAWEKNYKKMEMYHEFLSAGLMFLCAIFAIMLALLQGVVSGYVLAIISSVIGIMWMRGRFQSKNG